MAICCESWWMVRAVAEALLSAEATALRGAGYGERTAERTNARNGYRGRTWDTRVGTMAVARPSLRKGSYFPDWLPQRRRRAERALVAVIAERDLAGVSTRRVEGRVEGLVQTLGIASIAKSQVSELARSLDATVAAFRTRPLAGGPSPYLWLDALTQRRREGGRLVNVATVVATGVTADGHRQILGVDVITVEDGAGWTAFLRGLVARGLAGVQLVVSDAHEGLKQAIGAVLPGAGWQRCPRSAGDGHFGWKGRTRVPKAAQDLVGSLVRSIFAQPDAARVWAQQERIVTELAERFGAAAELLAEAAPDLLAFTAFPVEHGRQIGRTNPQERLNRAIRRRTDVVGIFPHRAAIIRLVGASLAEQQDAWAVARRSMSVESLVKARLTASPATTQELPMALPTAG